jgi:alpha-mannosidase
VGELYLETHRGTYTTHGAIKRANRRNELLLREAELFGLH